MPTTEPPRLPFGGIGPYRVLAEIGRGGMGVVYRAEDTRLNREVALKVLLPHLAAEPTARERFLREARAQAAIEHEHVLPVLEANEVNGVAYLVMPLLKGRTLAAELAARAGPMPPKDVLRIGREMAEGLAAAHARGYVHRDIKPTNVWLEGDKRRVRLLDFGLARTARDDTSADQLTVAGALVGTPAYMSPEQANGAPTDARSDLWSLGVVLYEMATGQKPFGGPNRSVVLYHVCESAPDDPLALAPHLPPALAALVLRLLSKNPDDRPQSAAAVAAVLSTIAAGPLPQVVPVRAPAAPTAPEVALETVANEPRPKRAKRKKKAKAEPNWVLIGIGGTFAFVLLIVLAIGLSGGKRPEPERAAVPADPPKPSWEPLKPKPEPKTEPPAPVVLPPNASDEDDSAAARALAPHASLVLRLPSGAFATVPRGTALPPGPFAVVDLDFLFDPLPPGYTESTFLPAVARMRSLYKVRMGAAQLALEPKHVREMAGMPFAARLWQLEASVRLTDEALTDLKRFSNLGWVVCRVPDPSDELFARFAELSKLTILSVRDVPSSKKLTATGWRAVAALRLDMFGATDSPACDGGALAELAAPGGPPTLVFSNCPLTDADFEALAARGTDAVGLHLFNITGATDATLTHLARVPSLKVLGSLNNTFSANAIQQFARDKPGAYTNSGGIGVFVRLKK